LHFFFSDFAPYLFAPFLVRWTFLWLIALLPLIFFANCAILHPSSFFRAILHPIFCPLSPLLMMILNKTQLTKNGVQNRSKKKRVCKIAQLAKDRGGKCN